MVGAELLSRFDHLSGVMLELMSRTSTSSAVVSLELMSRTATSSAVASFEVDVKLRLGAMNDVDLQLND